MYGLSCKHVLPQHRKYIYIGVILTLLFMIYRGYFYMQHPPQISIEYYNEGIALLQKEENIKAINAFNQAIKFAPRYCEAHANKAIALNKIGRYKEAVKEANKSLRISSKHKIALMAKEEAKMYLSLGTKEPVNFIQFMDEKVEKKLGLIPNSIKDYF